MEFTKKELEFIKLTLDFYWQEFNADHIDNKNDYNTYKNIINKL